MTSLLLANIDIWSLLGYIIAIIALAYIFYMLIRHALIPFVKKLKHGFFVTPQFNKLDKTKFKKIKKMHLYEGHHRTFVDYVLISNYGLFLVSRKDVYGVVEKSQDRAGNINRYKGHSRYLNDYVAENMRDIEKMKAISHIFREVEIYSVVVYPDKTEVKVTAEKGFAGNLRDMLGFIISQCNESKAISDEKKEELYKLLRKENSKNTG